MLVVAIGIGCRSQNDGRSPGRAIEPAIAAGDARSIPMRSK